jgi:hypothetical protein
MLKKYKSLDPMTKFTVTCTAINVAVIVASVIISNKAANNS